MIELATKVRTPLGEVHPLLKELNPIVNDYMNLLNNAEGNNSQSSNPQSPSNNNSINKSGIGSIHKTIWNHQANVSTKEEFIELQGIWNEIHLPILKNFYNLKLTILKNHKILNDNDYKKLRENVNCIVELRKLNNKYHKFLKKATEFYYSCLVDFMDIYYQMFEKNQYLSNELLQRFKEEGIIIGNASKYSSTASASQTQNQKSGNFDSENSGHSNSNSNCNNSFSSQHLFKKPLLFQQKYVNVENFKSMFNESAKQKILSCIYNICINIATLNYYSAIMETMNYKIQQFNKVLKWSTLGQFFENHHSKADSSEDFSRHHLLKSSVYFKCDCYGYAVVCLLRNEQRKQVNNVETFDMISNMLDIKGDQYKKILTHLQKLDYMNKDKGNRLIINKEIIEEYFLYCWNEILQKNILENSSSSLTPDYQYRIEVLKEKISIRYKKNILPIYINSLLCVSGALFLKNSNKATKQYYKYCSDYIVFVMGNAILKEFQNFLNEINNSNLTNNNSKNSKTFQNHYQYLAFVRVILQFVYNDSEFLKIVIENKEFVKVLATFVNLCGEYDPEILKKYTPQSNSNNINGKKALKELYPKPKRNYLYQEDLELLHWKDLNLNDFVDNSKNGFEKKTFLNYELLDEERSIMDIPTSKFKSKLEGIVNRIIPIINEFNGQNTMAGDRFKVINNKYCNNNNDVLDFALVSKDELFNNYSMPSINTNANNILNNSSPYSKNKQLQRNSRPHSFVTNRDGSPSPNLFKLNSNGQRTYSSSSPTNNQSPSTQFWNKRNSVIASSPSPPAENGNSEYIDLSKHQKPKMSQRAYSQPTISVAPKLERKKSDSNSKQLLNNNSSSRSVDDDDDDSETDALLAIASNSNNTAFPEQTHTPIPTNKSINDSYPTTSKSASISSPSTQNGTNNINNINSNMFVSWDSNIPINNNKSSMSAGMEFGMNFGVNHQSNPTFNSAGYSNGFSQNTSNGNHIGSSGFMGFAANNYPNTNSNNNMVQQQQHPQYNNLVSSMNNMSFGQPSTISQSQHGLEPSVSVPSFTGLMSNASANNATNNSYAQNPSFMSTESNGIEQQNNNNIAFPMYTTSSNGKMTTSGQNTAAENSPRKDVSWMNTSAFTPQQNQISTVSSNSIWDNSNVVPQPNSQLNIQNISQFNQFLTSASMSNNPNSNSASAGFAAVPHNGNAPVFSQSSSVGGPLSYTYANYGQQRPSTADQSLFQTTTNESDSSNQRYSNIQRSGSSGWYKNI